MHEVLSNVSDALQIRNGELTPVSLVKQVVGSDACMKNKIY